MFKFQSDFFDVIFLELSASALLFEIEHERSQREFEQHFAEMMEELELVGV